MHKLIDVIEVVFVCAAIALAFMFCGAGAR